MQFWTLDEIEQHAMADHEVGEEIAPGVTITRRRILQVGLAGAAGLLAMGCATPARREQVLEQPAARPLTIDQLVAQLRPEARRMIASDRPDEAAYLSAVSALLARYKPDEPWAMRDVGESGWSMNTAAWMPPVVVFDIHMQPGSKIHLHDHRHYNGVLLCTEGSVRCRNFDIVQSDGERLDIAAGEVPTGEDFLIRQNKDTTLDRGQLSTLSRDRDNIHHIEAGPDGCKLADLFTYFRREARSYELDWDEQPLERGSNTYRVSWRS
ncbi:MAG: hypothetical protein ACF8SC_01980 [Phycisphaerales bacterium JB037]